MVAFLAGVFLGAAGMAFIPSLACAQDMLADLRALGFTAQVFQRKGLN